MSMLRFYAASFLSLFKFILMKQIFVIKDSSFPGNAGYWIGREEKTGFHQLNQDIKLAVPFENYTAAEKQLEELITEVQDFLKKNPSNVDSRMFLQVVKFYTAD